MRNLKFKIPDSIGLRTEYKRKFSFSELYLAFTYVPHALFKLIGNRKNELLDKNFVERLQLAVTEVTACAACSYAHTLFALRQGMSNEEINSFLNGEDKFIQEEEARAILFAQHFAETRGYPEKETYHAIVHEYGEKKAEIILSAVQVMLAGNIYGLPYSALQSRKKGQAFKNSTLAYELGMMIFGVLILPFAFIHSILRWIIGKPNSRFSRPEK